MILDARNQSDGLEKRYDLCIVGAGAAGIPLALVAGEARGTSIALLEAGGFGFERDTQDHYRGEVTGDGHAALHRARYSGVGGSTELWAGWCRPLDVMDFEKRSWVPSSGWPIERSDLDDYYAQAGAWCGIGQDGFELEHGLALSDGASLGEGDCLVDRLYRVRKLRFKAAYRPVLERSENVTLINHATALDFAVGDAHERVEAVRIQTGSGKKRQIRAKRFVLASGGLENPRLLLLSGSTPERAIGNAHGQVGRYYNEHGFVNSGWFRGSGGPRTLRRYFARPHPDGADFGSVRHVLSVRQSVLEKEELNNAALFFHPAYEAHEAFDRQSVKSALELWEILKRQAIPGDYSKLLSEALSEPKSLASALRRKLFASTRARTDWRLRSYFESAPDASNRVELGDERDSLGRPRIRLTWSFGEQDLDSAERFHALIDRELQRNGAGRLEYLQGTDKWRQHADTGKHLMGATRMHQSPSRGVVDRDCRVHGTSNLYVAGSSVFPATGYANPTLTIVALAIRLAEHLKRLERYDR